MECERLSPKFSCQPDCATATCEQQVEKASAEPEMLPWRSRLKGYRLASRLFHGKEKKEAEVLPPPLQDEDKKEKEAEVLPPPSKAAELEQSDNPLRKPEIERPDLVLD